MKKTFLFLVLLSSFLNGEVLTLKECIDKTLKNHPDIKTFLLKEEQSKYGYKSARADYLPQINLNANYNAVQTYVFPSALTGTFNTKDDSGWNAGVYAKQKIWDFSKTTSKIKATKKDKDISKLSLKDLEALMAYKVRGLYALMVVQKEAIDVRKKDLEAKEAYYKQAKALVKQGLKTKADENRFLSSVYIAKANLEDAIASFLKAKNTLELYMKIDIPDDVTLQSEFLKVDLNGDLDTLEKNILSNNYQLKITQKNIEKNILLHKSSKASHYGSIDAVASYTHIDTLNSYDSKLAGITLDIPLYSGGRVSAEEQKAKISSSIAKEQKASKELELKEEMKSLLIDIKRFEKKILASKAQLEASKETKKVLDARYAQGLATYIEVLDATTQVLSAKLSLLESYYYKSMAIYRLEYLQGIIE